jgi:hypothetical protein
MKDLNFCVCRGRGWREGWGDGMLKFHYPGSSALGSVALYSGCCWSLASRPNMHACPCSTVHVAGMSIPALGETYLSEHRGITKDRNG